MRRDLLSGRAFVLSLSLCLACGNSARSLPAPGAAAGVGGDGGASFGENAGGSAGQSAFPSNDAIDSATGLIATEQCARGFACCASLYRDGFGYEDEPDCVARFGARLRGSVYNNREGVLAGRLAVNLGAAEPCGEKPIVCTESPGACGHGLIEPLVELGQSCQLSIECRQGYCERASGTCQPTLPPGSACGLDEECATTRCHFGVCADQAPAQGCE